MIIPIKKFDPGDWSISTRMSLRNSLEPTCHFWPISMVTFTGKKVSLKVLQKEKLELEPWEWYHVTRDVWDDPRDFLVCGEPHTGVYKWQWSCRSVLRRALHINTGASGEERSGPTAGKHHISSCHQNLSGPCDRLNKF